MKGCLRRGDSVSAAAMSPHEVVCFCRRLPCLLHFVRLESRCSSPRGLPRLSPLCLLSALVSMLARPLLFRLPSSRPYTPSSDLMGLLPCSGRLVLPWHLFSLSLFCCLCRRNFVAVIVVVAGPIQIGVLCALVPLAALLPFDRVGFVPPSEGWCRLL